MPTELPTIFLVVGPETDRPDDYGNGRAIYSVHYRSHSAGLTCTLRRQHSGDMVARCKGGGYDMTGTVLADALTTHHGVPAFDGGHGVSSVIGHAAAHGVNVLTLSDALYALPRPAFDGEAVAR